MMKWAFVDYENVNSLELIRLSDYEWIIVFCGPKDKKLKIDLSAIDEGKSPRLEIVRLDKSAKNNLDFHLALYLGRYHETVEEGVEFAVVSNDTGFDGVIAHLKKLGRKCKRIKDKASTVKKAASVKKAAAKKEAKKVAKKVSQKKVAKKAVKVNSSDDGSLNSKQLHELRLKALKAFKKAPDRNWPNSLNTLHHWLESSLAMDPQCAKKLMNSMEDLKYFTVSEGKVVYQLDLSKVQD